MPDTMNKATIHNDLDRGGITCLVDNTKRGIHTMPDGFTATYDDVWACIEDNSDRYGEVQGWKAEKAVAELCARLSATIYGGNGQAVITDHLQPALARIITGMKKDFITAGRYVSYTGSAADLLNEEAPVREAYTRLMDSHGVYHGLRSSWTAIRTNDGYELFDQLGITSPLAEVRNLPEVFEDWKRASAGRAPWPWLGTAHHVRMHWLLTNGAEVWCPTGAQQQDNWVKYNPQARVRVA